jgi:secreted trypsin-like serine protease
MRPLCHLAAALTILLLPTTADAGEVRVGDWSVDVADDLESVWAVVVNDSDSLLGEFCSIETGKCIWSIAMETKCEKDTEYPVLANTDAGATQLQIVCAGALKGGAYQYVFTNWSDLESLLKQSKRVGFAFPMQADQFQVVRFSIDGMTKASAAAERLADAIREKSPTAARNTRNQML